LYSIKEAIFMSYDFAARNSLPAMIAWLSLCLIAAGWGPLADAQLRAMWAQIGLFGLTAALALDLAKRARSAVRAHVNRKVASRRIERNFAVEWSRVSGQGGTRNGQSGDEQRELDEWMNGG
jgi:hypothetical protein